MLCVYNNIIFTVSFREISPQKHEKTMERLLICIFTMLCFVSASIGKKGFGPGEQDWGYVQVRPYANMFWWLYYTTADVKSYYDKPLIIWLQGGPGGSSTAYGNFEELGPLDTDLNPRNHTWVKDYNVLFIDNPVGAGFSYAENISAFATTNAQIASDLLECIREFYKQLPQFKPVPTYIATESYGGKMSAEFALVWDRAQKAGTIKSNLKGVVLGDPWISPIDSVMTWAPYLLGMGMIDTEDFKEINTAANSTKDKVEKDQWLEAFHCCLYTSSIIFEKTCDLNIYNILTRKKCNSSILSSQNVLSFDGDAMYRNFFQDETQSLDSLMNGPVKKALGLNVTHGNQSTTVYDCLREDFMKPVTNIVEQLLNETNLNVFIYNGQLDVVVDTPGTLHWVEKLEWTQWWRWLPREPLLSEEGFVEGFSKTLDKFCMYWINRAGHMVPKDNPAAMKIILRNLTSNAYN
ncbi:retinoid-inducible serine carboxypeptidase-like [Formica exsecta]|uniref:retinoid-inducible serine carboxypeptidase-like n=1 Tax=Formica exsecta TaxID=72781 RepID=UPI001144B398|nr:retinoid-inducible serine carboxypeptidase-like [Formica exsecta]